MRVTVNIDDELKSQLELIAAIEKKKIGEIADEAIKKFCDEKFHDSENGNSALAIGNYELKIKKVG